MAAETGAGSAEIAAALQAVAGVATADLEDGGADGLGRWRLSLQPDADEVAVAATVERLLRERFGIDVDADRLQLGDDASSGPASARGLSMVPVQRSSARPSIDRVQLCAAGLDVTATVSLSSGESLATGSCSGPAAPHSTHKVVATATLRAVEQLLEGAARLDLDHLEVARLGGESTVLVRLTLLTPGGSETLTGVAVVRDDIRQAVIRATLSAVNRRFEMLVAAV